MKKVEVPEILWKEIIDILKESSAHLDREFDYFESERFENKVNHLLELMEKINECSE
jgi:hypothetical protein